MLKCKVFILDGILLFLVKHWLSKVVLILYDLWHDWLMLRVQHISIKLECCVFIWCLDKITLLKFLNGLIIWWNSIWAVDALVLSQGTLNLASSFVDSCVVNSQRILLAFWKTLNEPFEKDLVYIWNIGLQVLDDQIKLWPKQFILKCMQLLMDHQLVVQKQ